MKPLACVFCVCSFVLFIRATFCVLLVCVSMCSVLVVLVKSSLLAKWLARKTPLRKPNRGEGIISTKPRPKSVYHIFVLVYCFIVQLFICLVPGPTQYISYSYGTI